MASLTKSHPKLQASPLPSGVIPSLLKLHAAENIDSLWGAIVALVRSHLPCLNLVATLPCEGLIPIDFRSTLTVPDAHAYRVRVESAEPPLPRIIAENPGVTLTFLDDHFSEAEILASRFYQEIMQPEGVRHVAALLFWENGQFLAHIGFNRTSAQGAFDSKDRALLEQFHPWFDAAIRRIRQTIRQHTLHQMLRNALEHPIEGIVLIDSSESVVFHNAAATEACVRWLGLPPNARDSSPSTSADLPLPDEIRAQASILLNQFRSSLSQAPATKSPAPRRKVQLNCEHPVHRGLHARLTLMTSVKQASPPHVEVRLSRIRKDRQSLPLHLLTPSEYRTAKLASDGMRNEAIADFLSVSVNTVRAHLRSVFDKLRIRHRGDLVTHFD